MEIKFIDKERDCLSSIENFNYNVIFLGLDKDEWKIYYNQILRMLEGFPEKSKNVHIIQRILNGLENVDMYLEYASTTKNICCVIGGYIGILTSCQFEEVHLPICKKCRENIAKSIKKEIIIKKYSIF